VKLVKRQINGDERVVLNESASLEDLATEAARLHRVFGYDVKLDHQHSAYLVTHAFYRAKFILALERE
jgi:hypothetical protein